MFITKIIQIGINQALLKHKQAGNPICTSKEGKVVWIPAEKIEIRSESQTIEEIKEQFLKKLNKK